MLSKSRRLFLAGINACLKPAGTQERKAFLDIGTTYPDLDNVTSRFPAIRDELQAVLNTDIEIPRYDEMDHGQKRISSLGDGRWNVFILNAFGWKVRPNQARCPATCAAIAKVPNVMQAFFSILEPGKSVPEHRGPYAGYLRYHLGLIVPKDRPPRLVVDDIPYEWREGEGVLFDDHLPHRVENDSEEMRAVLIIDLVRPLPFVPALLNRFVIGVLARYTYGLNVAARAAKYAK